MPLPDVVRQRLQPLNTVVTSNRIFLYSVFSTFAVAAAIINACRSHSNFYSVSIFLSRSSRSVLVLANFGFLFALLCGRVLQRLFFGPLQAREVERLYDQTWMFVTESLLAFTIFRDEFDIPFVLMFGFLLFVKCFHWLMADRVESMDQTTYPGPPPIFHIRMSSLFCVLWITDLVMFGFAVESTLANGVGGMVLFASEYAILMASAINAMARYMLSIIDLRRARTRGGEDAPLWEHKSMYVFYIELVTDFLKLATYLTFFMIILTFYGLPLNIIRDVYLTARSFITRLRALVRYRNATRDMDRRYPNATEAELVEMSDRTCIICREEMIPRTPQAPVTAGQDEASAAAQAPAQPDGPNMTPKKLPCGHIFHFQCLRSWLERQQSCPTCRRPVLETNAQNTGQAQGRAGPGVPRAPPQPGMIPQAPLAGQQGPGGPLGWVNRILGVPQQPPVPGQLGPGQFVGPPGAPPPQQGNVGWAPVQPPMAYYYPVGYAPYPPQAPPLQQAPVFRGFYGPGGVWQPWGVDPRPPPGPQQPPPTPAQTQPPAQHLPDATTPNGTPAASSEEAHSQASVSSVNLAPAPTMTAATSAAGTSEISPIPERQLSAREAAALAAERRMNTPRPSHSTANSESATPATVSDIHSTSGVTDRPHTPSLADGPVGNSFTPTAPPENLPGPSQPPSSASSSATATTAASTSQPPANSNLDGRQEVPPLIPLHDFATAHGMRQPMFSLAPPGPYAPQNAFFRATTARHQAGVTPQQQQSSYRPSSSQHQPRQGETRYVRMAVPATARTPVAQLPATLTDEQLARLDRLTRESIDERIRLLENVSGAVYRCIEELTRVRSVLPMAASIGTATPAQGQEQERAAAGAPSGSVAPSAPTPSGSRDAVGSADGQEAPSSSLSDDTQRQFQSGGSPTASTPSEEKVSAVSVETTE